MLDKYPHLLGLKSSFFLLKLSMLPATCKMCAIPIFGWTILPDLPMFFPNQTLLPFVFFDVSPAGTQPTLLARSSRAGAASASVSLSFTNLRLGDCLPQSKVMAAAPLFRKKTLGAPSGLFWSSSSTLVTTTLSKVPRDAGSFCRALGSEVSRAVSKSNLKLWETAL